MGGTVKQIELLVLILALTASALTQAQSPGGIQQSHGPVQVNEEVQAHWRRLGQKLRAMAEDFPEDRYSFRPQKDQYSFGQQFVHVADDAYIVMSAIKGSPLGPLSGKPLNSNQYKSKASVVELIKQVFADGTTLLQQQGDDGLSRQLKSPFGDFTVRASTLWLAVIEHAAEHYGQLVVYWSQRSGSTGIEKEFELGATDCGN
jgi:uncharacterized damage-inducible protein DinB